MTSDHSGSVINSYVAGLIATVKLQGIDEAELFALLPMEQEQVTRPGARLDLQLMTMLWKRAVALTKDEYLGLHVGQQIHSSAYNVLSGLVLNSRNVQTAIEQVIHYQALVSEGGTIDLVNEGESCFLHYTPIPSKIPMTHYQIEGIISGMVRFSQIIVSQGLPLLQVEFAHNAPDNTQPYEDFFACPVIFSAKRNGFSFDSNILKVEIPHCDPELFSHHQALADKKLKIINRAQGLSNKVNRVIENEIYWFELSPDKVAKNLNISLRQMQRLLKEEGASYQNLLDIARKEKAASLLQLTQMNTNSIAEQLGYHNLSSFHRAFQRWYGDTPAEFREKTQ